MTIGEKIKKRRKELGLTLEDVATKTGVTRQTISRYEHDVISNIPMARLQVLTAALNITPADLLEIEKLDLVDYQPNKQIPVLGRISAGLPLYAEEHIEGYILEDVGEGEYFALRVKGDSMNAAHIFEGSLLIIRKQDYVENGEIAVVMIDDEDATVKRFYRKENMVTLMPQSTNPKHMPQIYDTSQTCVRIIGKVIKCEILFD